MKKIALLFASIGLLLINYQNNQAQSSEQNFKQKFRGIDVVLTVDAVPNAEMLGVKIHDDQGSELFGGASVSRRNSFTGAFGNARVPLSVRVTWRDHPKAVFARGGIDFEGPILGDYVLPVAERIPVEVLADIRAYGGSLRLKFRLKPDGVMFGWDIMRDGAGTSYVFRYDMPGGDFQAARIFNGKAVVPGWFLDSQGRKVPTDF